MPKGIIEQPVHWEAVCIHNIEASRLSEGRVLRQREELREWLRSVDVIRKQQTFRNSGSKEQGFR